MMTETTDDAAASSEGAQTDAAEVSEATRASDTHRVDPRLLEILVCPLTKTTLEYDAESQELISRAARLAYPIRDGIPVLLAEEARALPDND